MKSQYYNIKEVADYLRLTTRTVYDYTSKRTIPHYKVNGKLLFKIEEISSWVNNFKVDICNKDHHMKFLEIKNYEK